MLRMTKLSKTAGTETNDTPMDVDDGNAQEQREAEQRVAEQKSKRKQKNRAEEEPEKDPHAENIPLPEPDKKERLRNFLDNNDEEEEEEGDFVVGRTHDDM